MLAAAAVRSPLLAVLPAQLAHTLALPVHTPAQLLRTRAPRVARLLDAGPRPPSHRREGRRSLSPGLRGVAGLSAPAAVPSELVAVAAPCAPAAGPSVKETR